MKQNKDQYLKTCITSELKEKIDAYCKTMELSTSAFLRLAIRTFFDRKEENEE